MPLLISFVGRSDLKTLTHCELRTRMITLSHDRLSCSFYLNELLMRLLHPQMAFPDFFEFYEQTLHAVAYKEQYVQFLRLFEKQLLQTLGYELMLHQDNKEEPIKPEPYYLYIPEQGLSEVDPARLPSSRAVLQGKTLLALANDNLCDVKICSEAKIILQAALKHLLGDKPIRSQHD
jgi:DNA repair protein RecO (recombination protein O)